MDYEKGNEHLPNSMRSVIEQPSRIVSSTETSAIRLFTGDDKLAIQNNEKAYKVASGFLKEVHYANITTGLAPRLSDVLVSKICGNVTYEGNDADVVKLKEVFNEHRLAKVLKIAFSDAVDTGRGCIFVNYLNKKIQIRTFNNFRVIIKRDIFDEICEAYAYIMCKPISDFEEWIVIEKRYYNKENQPCQKYILCKSDFDRLGKPDEIKRFDKVEEVPKSIIEMLQDIKLYQEMVLEGFNDLGVYPIDNTIKNRKMKYSSIPESQFVNIQDLLIERDITETQKATEQHIGRGKVLIPSFMGGAMNIPGGNNNKIALPSGKSKMDNAYMVQYESKSMQDCKPESVQFDFRAEQWRASIAGTVGDICAAFGLGLIDIDPRYLQNGANTTDDEINALTDITAATVKDKRESNEDTINAMLNTMGALIGCKEKLFIRWSMASILNPTKNEALIGMQLSNGTISREVAIKRSNPDYTEAEVVEELNRINSERMPVDL